MDNELNGLSGRAKNVLVCMGVRSKEELLKLGSPMELPKILSAEWCCGAVTVREIQLWLGLPPMTVDQARRAKQEALTKLKELNSAEALLIANGWTVTSPTKD